MIKPHPNTRPSSQRTCSPISMNCAGRWGNNSHCHIYCLLSSSHRSSRVSRPKSNWRRNAATTVEKSNDKALPQYTPQQSANLFTLPKLGLGQLPTSINYASGWGNNSHCHIYCLLSSSHRSGRVSRPKCNGQRNATPNEGKYSPSKASPKAYCGCHQ